MKKLFKFVAILVVVLFIAVVAAVIFVPKSVILNQVLAQVERQSGRSVSVGEDVALSFYPQLSLTANDLRVSNAPWATDPQMITAQRVRFGLQTMPLLRGEVIAETIELIRPVVSFETGADGAGNWVLVASGDDAEMGDATHEADALDLPHFKNIHIEEGLLRYADQGAVTTVEVMTLDLGWPSYEGALTARLSARVKGTPVAVEAEVAQITQLITDARLEADLRSARYDTMTLSGPMAVDLSGDVPMVTGQLALGPISMPTSDGEGTANAPTAGWSTDPIDAAALGSVNADIGVSGPSIQAAGLTIGAYRGQVTLDAARMVAVIDTLTAYQGTVSGQVVVNARKGLSAAADLSVTDLAAQPLLSDLAGVQAFEAPLSGQVDVLVVGQSMDAMMKSLSGTVQFAAQGGRINGVDLDKLLRSGDASGGTTVFETFSGQFDAQNGVLTGDDLALILPNFRTDGAGAIDLGRQQLDYLLSPTATGARDGKGLSIPVRIKGPWSQPSILPDLEALARQNAAEELDKARQAAEDKAKALLEEKTGITVEEGQSAQEAVTQKVESELTKAKENAGKKIEDEVKKKLEDQLKQGIGGLFGN